MQVASFNFLWFCPYSVMMQDVPPDLLNFEEVEELDPDSRLHQEEEDKR